MLEGKKSYAELPLSRKKGFEKGVVVPSKIRESDSCKDDEVCMKYELKTKQTKVFLAILKGQVNRRICLLTFAMNMGKIKSSLT